MTYSKKINHQKPETKTVWDSIPLPLPNHIDKTPLSNSLISVTPMTREEYLEGLEERQYPNRYDDFTDINAIEWYIVDHIDLNKLDKLTLSVYELITFPLNFHSDKKKYKYVDDIGILGISCHSPKRDMDKERYDVLDLKLNPQRWQREEILTMISKIKKLDI